MRPSFVADDIIERLARQLENKKATITMDKKDVARLVQSVQVVLVTSDAQRNALEEIVRRCRDFQETSTVSSMPLRNCLMLALNALEANPRPKREPRARKYS